MTELQNQYRQFSEWDDENEIKPPRSDSFSFIVRVWKDTSTEEDNPASWRGSIEQVGLNQRIYVHQLDSILAFIEERTGMRVKHPPALGTLWKGLQHWWRMIRTRYGNG